MGHKKIVIIVPDDATDNIKLRITGFKEELTDQNINPDETVSIIFTPLTKLGGYDVAGAVIDSGASAVFAVNDEMAIGLYRGLKNLGIEVPRDISVMGYDGIDLGTYVEPALTTIQQPIARMGELAMQLLINRINNPDINHQVVELPVRLIQRESVVNISTI
ncbi:LacI family DNA-binding transcriptional regulator [Secundilactobacillus paracollinoides]|nr:substrate-binding domain-containing protein [Secundilactobacillus paracollinoides]